MADLPQPGRRRLLAVAGLAALVVLSSACGGGGTTRLRAVSALDSLDTTEAYVDTVYDASPARLVVAGGTDRVTVLSVTVGDHPKEVEVVPAALVHLDGKDPQVGSAAGDPPAGYPNVRLVPPKGVRIGVADRDTWYVLLRVKPHALGTFDVGDVRVRYRAGGATRTVRLPIVWHLVVDHTGHDPRLDIRD